MHHRRSNQKGGRGMKRKLVAVIVCTCICMLTTGFVYAAERGTAKEAQDLVEKAIAYYKSNGKDMAFAAINDPKGQFTKKDLYVYVIDLTSNIMLAHGANKALIGKNMVEIRDAKGKQFQKEMAQGAKTKGKGWVDYSWTNPETKKIGAKSTYYQREGDMYFACGIYK
jgi:cytochrome c